MNIIITIIIVLEYLFLEKNAGTNPCGWYRCWTKPLSPIAVFNVSLENCSLFFHLWRSTGGFGYLMPS